jgi:hypothetical protein
MKLRDKLALKPEEPLPVLFAGCWALKESNAPIVEEGIAALAKAIDLQPEYDDTMAYMNLLYRERAEIQCGDSAARAADLEAADHWADLTLSSKQAKDEKSRRAQSGAAKDKQ